MRKSSLLTAAAFALSRAGSSAAFAANFSGIPEQQTQLPADASVHQQRQLQRHETSPYDSPDFVVPPYEINS